MAYIEFVGVNKYFDKTHVLKDINLTVEHGEFVTLLGPSGCGKSTLLRCLAGLETVSSGRIFLAKYEITHLEPQHRDVGMVFQQYSLFPNMTAAQNTAFGLKIQGMKKNEIKEKVRSVLDLLGLQDRADYYPRQLSGGQQQRVALARAIVMEPKVLLLDEPLSAIDAMLRRNLQIEIRRIQRSLNMTTLFVTHDQDEAMVMSDRIHLFNVGHIEQSGLPTELYTRPRTKFAASFIGHYNIVPAAQFSAASGWDLPGTDVAVRPEVIGIAAAGLPAEEQGIELRGTVRGSIPHGNIIRYTVDCGAFRLNADVLFDTRVLFNEHDEVRLSIAAENVLTLD
ncbi:MAG: ABC transporter ATP-binding protein [Treponema sp.]|jgi:putative spermidine/putrescine transport system ATP-binding protein|nr:ABC transporter ATP-binding protein [Treponema sp.]